MTAEPERRPKEPVSLATDLSHILEEKLREERVRRWSEENVDAFRDYNADIEKSGVWSDGRRSW